MKNHVYNNNKKKKNVQQRVSVTEGLTYFQKS